MKINTSNFKIIENAYKLQSSNTYAKNKVETKNDRVEFSQTAKYLSNISTREEKIDEKKINEIKNKIESGTYKIDSKTIARKILEDIKGERK